MTNHVTQCSSLSHWCVFNYFWANQVRDWQRTKTTSQWWRLTRKTCTNSLTIHLWCFVLVSMKVKKEKLWGRGVTVATEAPKCAETHWVHRMLWDGWVEASGVKTAVQLLTFGLTWTAHQSRAATSNSLFYCLYLVTKMKFWTPQGVRMEVIVLSKNLVIFNVLFTSWKQSKRVALCQSLVVTP